MALTPLDPELLAVFLPGSCEVALYREGDATAGAPA